ncbi:MAG: RAMP superfamily CRISPR-associated protein [Sulfurovum sp.]|nr:RAMP superfamily CRISPR-associated protein [Sulfurovum sp.]
MKTKYIAHITLEAETPLKVGSAASDFVLDSPIQRDWNALPMILGTSIAGVLRKDFEGDANDVFGSDTGSKVIFSNALLVDENNRVHEELLLNKSAFLNLFDVLPVREHTAITEKGVAKEHSKFDEEVVYKGTRFRFSIEMMEDENAFNKLLSMLQSPSFRLGGGSTKGFGKFKIISIANTKISTNTEWIDYSSSLNSLSSKDMQTGKEKAYGHSTYSLNIQPDDFFMFGSGFGDDDADQIPVVEKVIDYDKKCLSENYLLMPASSLKGAIAHRTAYHYNLQNNLFVGNEEAKLVVHELFGEAKNSKQDIEGSKGKVLFSDAYKRDNNETKVFDHVAIDRFTGGGLDGALFQEKTTAQKDVWEIEILLENGVDDVYVKALEATLDDICNGMLPLGGATTKGHGIFNGTWSKS